MYEKLMATLKADIGDTEKRHHLAALLLDIFNFEAEEVKAQYEEGLADGYDEGYNDGWQDGYDEPDKMPELRSRIRDLERYLHNENRCRIWMRNKLEQIMDSCPYSLHGTQWDVVIHHPESDQNSLD